MVKKKLMRLADMEAIARVATHDALKSCMPPSKEDENALVLGKLLTDEAGVFELYVPGPKPEDARIISRTTVNRVTGEVVSVEVFLPKL
ncbi:MAG TPA: hypothetical protein VF457_13560 [Burkholderiaceae bacterium]